MMRFTLGVVEWSVRLETEPIMHEGRARRGLAIADDRLILIDANLSPAVRLFEFWHELGHAARFELDIHDAEFLGHEPSARLWAMAMSRINPRGLAMLHIYLTTGIEPDDALILSGCEHPIPVIRLTGD